MSVPIYPPPFGETPRSFPSGRRKRLIRAGIALGIIVILAIAAAVVHVVTSNPAKGLEAKFTQSIDWQKCATGYRCASVDAPLDWSDSNSKSIHLALFEHVTTGTSEGTLLFNPGGPGESAVDYLEYGVTGVVSKAVAAKYDVVAFDPPGVGYSTAVKCYDAKGTDSYLYGILPGKVGSSEWLAADRKVAKAFGTACKKNTGDLLGHVDTTSAARDMDLVRADLGSKKLNYLGYSYGTYLGTVYAGLYPKNVGRFVFDGADDPWVDQKNTDVVQIKGFEGDLKAYMAACLAGKKEALDGAACPFTGTVSDGMSQVSALLTGVDEHPLAAKDGRLLGSSTLSTGIIESLYSTTLWPTLTKAMTQAKAGNPTTAFALADQYNDRKAKGTYEDNATEAFIAVGCLEGATGDSLKSMRKEATRLTKAAPVLGKYQAYSEISCAEWPVKSEPFPAEVHANGAAPILIVGTTGDPATPYSEATALAKQLSSGHLVTYHGEGHTAYNQGHSCVDDAVDAYLLRGVVPTKDPQCH